MLQEESYTSFFYAHCTAFKLSKQFYTNFQINVAYCLQLHHPCHSHPLYLRNNETAGVKAPAKEDQRNKSAPGESPQDLTQPRFLLSRSNKAVCPSSWWSHFATYLLSDGLFQSLTDLSSNYHMERGFFLTQPGCLHESHGKHRAMKWAERGELLIYLMEVLAAAMKKKGKPQGYLWSISGNKANSPVEIKDWFSKIGTHLWETSLCYAKMQGTNVFPLPLYSPLFCNKAHF